MALLSFRMSSSYINQKDGDPSNFKPEYHAWKENRSVSSFLSVMFNLCQMMTWKVFTNKLSNDLMLYLLCRRTDALICSFFMSACKHTKIIQNIIFHTSWQETCKLSGSDQLKSWLNFRIKLQLQYLLHKFQNWQWRLPFLRDLT